MCTSCVRSRLDASAIGTSGAELQMRHKLWRHLCEYFECSNFEIIPEKKLLVYVVTTEDDFRDVFMRKCSAVLRIAENIIMSEKE